MYVRYIIYTCDPSMGKQRRDSHLLKVKANLGYLIFCLRKLHLEKALRLGQTTDASLTPTLACLGLINNVQCLPNMHEVPGSPEPPNECL